MRFILFLILININNYAEWKYKKDVCKFKTEIKKYQSDKRYRFKDEAIKDAISILNFSKKYGFPAISYSIIEENGEYYYVLDYLNSGETNFSDIENYELYYDRYSDKDDVLRKIKTINSIKIVFIGSDDYEKKIKIKYINPNLQLMKCGCRFEIKREYFVHIMGMDYKNSNYLKNLLNDLYINKVFVLGAYQKEDEENVFYIDYAVCISSYSFKKYSIERYESINLYRYYDEAIKNAKISVDNISKKGKVLYYDVKKELDDYSFYIDYFVENKKCGLSYIKDFEIEKYNEIENFDSYNYAYKKMVEKQSSFSNFSFYPIESYVKYFENNYSFVISYMKLNECRKNKI